MRQIGRFLSSLQFPSLQFSSLQFPSLRSPLFILITFSLVALITLSSFRSNAASTDQITDQVSVEMSADVGAIAQVDLSQPFAQLGLEGSIVIYDQNAAQFYEHNPTRNTTAFFPLSTFKILNALISLETGVIRDDVSVLTWDGIEREVPAWNRDSNLRQAFKDSVVWFYQVLARKVGHERMQNFVNQVEYGDRNIGTAEAIDRFWLEGPLQITPRQQIEFLRKLYRNELPFSQRTLDLVKDVMIVERTPDYVLRGKTGLGTITPTVWPKLGWFVGYLEQNDNVYFFATNLEMQSDNNFSARLEVTRQCLRLLN